MSELNNKIRKFYNNSSPLWLNAWGEHMHHGYYGTDGKNKVDDKQAQTDLILQLLKWGNINTANEILDAGCGVGGSARFLSRHFEAAVTGVTLSNVQAEFAEELNKKAGANNVHIKVQDMMSISETEQKYDLIWSLESAEHIEDKKKLLELFYSVLQPGGKFIMATWCVRNSPPEINEKEISLMQKLSSYYHLPKMISQNDYENFAQTTGFNNVITADWTLAVAPFWDSVLRSALKWKNIGKIFTSGFGTIKGAWAIQFMKKGFKNGTIKFIVVQGEKI